MPSKHPLAAPLHPVKRTNLDQENDSGSDYSAESDWEEGRTLVPPEHESNNTTVQQNAYLLELVDSLAEPFAQKATSHKRRALAALEPTLDFTAAMHAQLVAVVDAPFLKGVDAFDASAGRMHGAIVDARETISSTTSRTSADLRALLKTLSALLKTRQACIDRFRDDVAAQVDALRAELDATAGDLDELEKATDKKEKALVKQAKEGGVAKRDADKLIKQLLGA